MDFNQVKGVAAAKAAEVKEKVENIDWADVKDQVKALDMGVLYTKAEDAMAKVDVKAIKQKVIDKIDSPEADKVKGALRTVKDFVGYVPYYAQSVPNMIKEALGKDV